VVPEIPPNVAVIVVEPTLMAVANPLEPAALLIEATASSDEFQVTCVVRSCVEPSEYLPVAVNCRVVPRAILGLTGSIVIDCRVAGVTVRVVVPEIPSIAAVMVVEPTARAVANPLEPAVLLIEATAPSDELQVTCVVRSCFELSE
jgi:hypothetical protein